MSSSEPNQRPNMGGLSPQQTEFLQAHLENYEKFCLVLAQTATGPRKTGSVKGEKQKWIKKHVLPKFISEFHLNGDDGPNKASVDKKVQRWFTNRTPKDARPVKATPGPVIQTPAPGPGPKRPPGVKVIEIFGKERKDDIDQRLKEEAKTKGKVAGEDALERYRVIRREMFDDLDADVKAEFSEKAKEKRKLLREAPETSLIYGSQKSAVTTISQVLEKFVGWQHGQFGDIVFFLQGAYRTEKGDIKTFHASIGPDLNDSDSLENFADTITYKESIRGQFRAWASRWLLPNDGPKLASAPETSAVPELQISNGRPLLPNIILEETNLKTARALLTAFLRALWQNGSVSAARPTTPWEDLNDSTLVKTKVLAACSQLSHVKSLDPQFMSFHEVIDVLKCLLDAQRAGTSLPFDFGSLLNNTEEDIVEIPDPCTADLPSGITFAIENLNLNVSPANPAPSTTHNITKPGAIVHVAHGIGEDQSSHRMDVDIELEPALPLSETQVATAIRNVAAAGFLTITTDTAVGASTPTNSLPSIVQAHEGAKVSTSKATKSKKQRHKPALPLPQLPRKQSARIRQDTYKNSAVNIRRSED